MFFLLRRDVDFAVKETGAGTEAVEADGAGGETRLRPPRARFLSLGSMILRKERGRKTKSTLKKKPRSDGKARPSVAALPTFFGTSI